MSERTAKYVPQQFTTELDVSEIDWTDWDTVVDEIHNHYLGFYFLPTFDLDNSTAVALIMLPVINSLSALEKISPYELLYCIDPFFKNEVPVRESENVDTVAEVLHSMLTSVVAHGYMRDVKLTGTGSHKVDGFAAVVNTCLLRDTLYDSLVEFCDELKVDYHSIESCHVRHVLVTRFGLNDNAFIDGYNHERVMKQREGWR